MTRPVGPSSPRGRPDARSTATVDTAAFIAASAVAFEEEAAAALAASMWLVDFDAGEFLFHQGQPCDRFSIVVSGEIDVQRSSTDGRDLVFVTLRSGAPIGEVSIFEGSPRTASLRARTPATLLTIGRMRFLELLAEHPSMALSLARYLASVVERLSGNVEGKTFLRLDAQLFELLENLGVDDGAGGLRVATTQQALADRLGVTRESVNKQLGAWAGHDLVLLRRGTIRIPEPDELRRTLS